MSTTGFTPDLRAACDSEDVIDVLALARFASGEHPVFRRFSLTDVRSAASLVPPGSVLRSATAGGEQQLLAGHDGTDGWTAEVHRYDGGHTEVWISGVREEVVDKVEAAIRAGAPAPVDRPDLLSVDFWFLRRKPERRSRRVDAPAWGEVRRNYPRSTGEMLAHLVDLDPAGTAGRLLVWHGPPGTGKTTAARALLRAWAPWCRGLVVTDPDRLFGDPGYLMDVLLDDSDEERWRLLVLEDADDVLRPDARTDSAAALSRLLNSADGFIGQGLKVLVLLSTNQRRVAIDPAILRPGRCIAEVEFGLFAPAEATEWLGDSWGGRVDRAVSLAEMFRLQAGEPLPTVTAPGQYL